jgi:hypothetical protein
LAAGREQAGQLAEKLPGARQPVNQVDRRDHLEAPAGQRRQVQRIADLKLDVASLERVGQHQAARAKLRARLLHRNRHPMALRHSLRGPDEGSRVVDPQHVANQAAQFKGEPAHGAAKVQAPGLAAAAHRQQVFLAEPLMEAQQLARYKWKGAKVPGPPVVEHQVFVQIARRLVGIEPHSATCFTNSVGW